MKGFTLLEMVVVVAILGIFMVASYPAVMNSMETRQLDNSAREIMSVLQNARFKSVDTKIYHRVRFSQENGNWLVRLELVQADGLTWVAARGYTPKIIPAKFVFTMNLPVDQSVVFSSVGVIEGYDSTKNSLSLQSLKLKSKGQPDLRLIHVFGGGSIRYLRTSS